MPTRSRKPSAPLESVARPKQARSEATLQRILEAAEGLIAKKGFAEISIPEIVQRAHSSVGGFYARFKDKNALLRALEERFFRRLSDRLDRVSDPAAWAGADLEDLIRGLIHELVSAADEERHLMGAMLARGTTDPELRNETVRFRRDVAQRITPLFVAHASRVRHPDPAMAVAQLYRRVVWRLGTVGL